MTTDEDLKQAEALVKILKKKKKAENAKPTLTTVQKEKMQAGVVFGWSATKIAQEALNKGSGRDVKLVRETLNSLGYKYVNGKFVGKKVRLRVLPDKETKKDKLPSKSVGQQISEHRARYQESETITIKKFSKKKGKRKGTYRKVKRTRQQLIKEGHKMDGSTCALCHKNPCPYWSRFKSQKKTTVKKFFTVLKQCKRKQDRPNDVNRYGLKEGHRYDLAYCKKRAENIHKHHKEGQNVDGTPMASQEKHDNWEQYHWYPCPYCFPTEALEYILSPEDREALETGIARNSYSIKWQVESGFTQRVFVWRFKGGLFIDKTFYDLAKDFMHSKGKRDAEWNKKQKGRYAKKNRATGIIKEQVTEIEKKEVKPKDDGIIIEDNEHPEGISLSQQEEEEKAKGKQEVKDSLDNAGRKTKKLVTLAKRKFSPEQLEQMAEDMRNEQE